MSIEERTGRRAEIVIRTAMEMSLGTGDDYSNAAAEAQVVLATAIVGLARLAKDPKRALAMMIGMLQEAKL